MSQGGFCAVGYPSYAYRPSECAIRYLAEGEEAMLALAASMPWKVPDDLAAAGIQGDPMVRSML